MNRSSPNKPLKWSEIGVAVLLVAVVAVGLASYNRTAAECLAAVAFLAAVLGVAALWQRTVQQARTAGPLTRGEWWWNAVVFVAFLAALAGIVWCWR